jgi:hypothetical protein
LFIIKNIAEVLIKPIKSFIKHLNFIAPKQLKETFFEEND